MINVEAAPIADLADLPATVDIPTAGRFFGLGKEASYELNTRGEFPVPVLRLGGRFRVVTAALANALGVDLDRLHAVATVATTGEDDTP